MQFPLSVPYHSAIFNLQSMTLAQTASSCTYCITGMEFNNCVDPPESFILVKESGPRITMKRNSGTRHSWGSLRSRVFALLLPRTTGARVGQVVESPIVSPCFWGLQRSTITQPQVCYNTSPARVTMTTRRDARPAGIIAVVALCSQTLLNFDRTLSERGRLAICPPT
jgi:hypothetical protein